MVYLGFLRAVLALSFGARLALGFGLTEDGDSFVVDTSAGLIFTVDSTSGDVTSMEYNGIQTQATDKNSHIASGIGATCDWTQGGNDNNYITITCTTSTLTQYYVAQYNSAAIHMYTYTTAEPDIGELRFIARLDTSTVPNAMVTACDVADGTAIEGSDVFEVDGETRSKFYSSVQFIDDQVHGVTGDGVGVYMIMPGTAYEASSGGPFFRDINDQRTGDNELYFYMNSGHTQTEDFRQGGHGPYALWFTDGDAPSTFDYTFWEDLDVEGYVAQASRGRVSGTASGVDSAYSSLLVIGWANSDNEYWVRTSSDGSFTSPYMKPGTYTQTLYKVEQAVATQEVTVSAGGTASSDISSTEEIPDVIWQIGDLDGTPRGLLNADKIETMHPSDSRMSSWGPVTYNVDSDSQDAFPMALFKAVGDVTINFSLDSSQTGARTLDVATTLAFAGGRPQVTVNDFTGDSPAAPDQPDSRGVTRGTWRGNNIIYTTDIPDGTLVEGDNTITITVISGSSGDDFLSPNFVFDAIRLY